MKKLIYLTTSLLFISGFTYAGVLKIDLGAGENYFFKTAYESCRYGRCITVNPIIRCIDLTPIPGQHQHVQQCPQSQFHPQPCDLDIDMFAGDFREISDGGIDLEVSCYY